MQEPTPEVPDPTSDLLPTVEDPVEEARKALETDATSRRMQKILGYLSEGNMPYAVYKGLEANIQKLYRKKWNHDKANHVGGRPLTPSEIKVRREQEQKKRKAKKVAKQSRKKNR